MLKSQLYVLRLSSRPTETAKAVVTSHKIIFYQVFNDRARVSAVVNYLKSLEKHL